MLHSCTFVSVAFVSCSIRMYSWHVAFASMLHSSAFSGGASSAHLWMQRIVNATIRMRVYARVCNMFWMHPESELICMQHIIECISTRMHVYATCREYVQVCMCIQCNAVEENTYECDIHIMHSNMCWMYNFAFTSDADMCIRLRMHTTGKLHTRAFTRRRCRIQLNAAYPNALVHECALNARACTPEHLGKLVQPQVYS